MMPLLKPRVKRGEGPAAKEARLKKELEMEKEIENRISKYIEDPRRKKQQEIEEYNYKQILEAQEKIVQKDAKQKAKKKLKEEYNKIDYLPYTDERDKYRRYILSLSLFPNLFNHHQIMTSLGSS